MSRRLAQAGLDKVIHVHRVQFETEFRVLADILAKTAVLRSAVGALRPMADIVDPDEDLDARLKRRIGAFEVALHDFMRAVDDQSPFYPEDIFRELSEALTIANRKSVSVSLGKPEKSSDWFKGQGSPDRHRFKKLVCVHSDRRSRPQYSHLKSARKRKNRTRGGHRQPRKRRQPAQP